MTITMTKKCIELHIMYMFYDDTHITHVVTYANYCGFY